mmetsp:Transcript_40461/g.109361  ORF Transcript_40461/g.109361 Transcript_40461/m.109361 type:complete len:239 (+) Transcript_40461:355-1071(+)
MLATICLMTSVVPTTIVSTVMSPTAAKKTQSLPLICRGTSLRRLELEEQPAAAAACRGAPRFSIEVVLLPASLHSGPAEKLNMSSPAAPAAWPRPSSSGAAPPNCTELDVCAAALSCFAAPTYKRMGRRKLMGPLRRPPTRPMNSMKKGTALAARKHARSRRSVQQTYSQWALPPPGSLRRVETRDGAMSPWRKRVSTTFLTRNATMTCAKSSAEAARYGAPLGRLSRKNPLAPSPAK